MLWSSLCSSESSGLRSSRIHLWGHLALVHSLGQLLDTFMSNTEVGLEAFYSAEVCSGHLHFIHFILVSEICKAGSGFKILFPCFSPLCLFLLSVFIHLLSPQGRIPIPFSSTSKELKMFYYFEPFSVLCFFNFRFYLWFLVLCCFTFWG